MCCLMCESMHEGHKKAFFKDEFIYPNYDNVTQITSKTITKQATIHSCGNVFLSAGKPLPYSNEQVPYFT